MQELPGGLWHSGSRFRDYRFKPIDGALEMTLSEAGQRARSAAHAVTWALSTALETLAGKPPSTESVRRLCVADRQFLMRQLALRLGERTAWLNANCAHCRARFDFHIDYERLPVTVSEAYRESIDVDLDGRRWSFRLPNGGDQEALTGAGDNLAEELLRRCCLSPDNSLTECLTDEQKVCVDQALEQASPGVVTELEAPCPVCGHCNRVDLNPYSALSRSAQPLLSEVHQIALHYHWSEQDILQLPRARRAQYLQLIDRSRGMIQ